jgi:hypothetical protein
MTFKPRVQSALSRDELLETGRSLEFDVTSRMSVADLRNVLAKSKRAPMTAVVGQSRSNTTHADSGRRYAGRSSRF